MNKKIVGVGAVIYTDNPLSIEVFKERMLNKYNCCISPLHDRDIKADGTLKKPHYHILFVGKLLERDKKELSVYVANGYFEYLYDLSSAYNYLYHWDIKNACWYKNKAHYCKDFITYSDNFDLEKVEENNNDYFNQFFDDVAQFDEFYLWLGYVRNINNSVYREYCLKNYRLADNFIRSYRNCAKLQRMDKESATRGLELSDAWLDNTYVHYADGTLKCDLRTHFRNCGMSIEEAIDQLNEQFPVEIEKEH